jgi:hypothetical protein
MFLLAAILSMALSASALAHSGRTDASGGHRDNNNVSGLGSYHYHHGYGPHLHPNGVCTYETVSVPAAPVPLAPQPVQPTVPGPQKDISVVVSGKTIAFDQPPENINGRVMVPIRYVVEEMGCTVQWDGTTQTVYIFAPDVLPEISATAGNEINVYVNNLKVNFLDQQPVNKNGRVLIPVRFVTERLGYEVEWDVDSQTVIIT